MSESVYDDSFFDYTDGLSITSARRMIPAVQSLLPRVDSVADFGCARGAWLRIWQDCGASRICGLDGDYVDRSSLHIADEAFIIHDLTQPIDLGQKFDLVQSLEVAEHLPRASAEIFVGSLTSHSEIVLFSAAPPGQGGAHHVNERPYEFWRDIFAKQGFQLFDCVRPVLLRDTAIQPWYRFNSFLYVHADRVKDLSETVRQTRILDSAPIADVSPFAFKLRKAVASCLPAPVQNRIASALSRWRAQG
ncbi:MAG: class I SAM-dependent methyltransferase [Paracoccaceae bacterium]|nr:class I SAM-dependent methyltransferase [Paracoccaceae bacterium]